jgi:hypothetical protein
MAVGQMKREALQLAVAGEDVAHLLHAGGVAGVEVGDVVQVLQTAHCIGWMAIMADSGGAPQTCPSCRWRAILAFPDDQRLAIFVTLRKWLSGWSGR